MAKVRERLTYANVMATLALFVALGGTTYAAATLPRNSVGSRQLRSHAVTASKIKPGAVTSARVRDHSLTGADIDLSKLGKVPATTSADHAAAADHAGNADSLDGVTAEQLRVGCPSGTVRYAGACFETAERAAADWITAGGICGSIGRRLPTPSELENLARGTQISFSEFEWTDTSLGSGAYLAARDDEDEPAGGGSLGYRCVAPLTN